MSGLEPAKMPEIGYEDLLQAIEKLPLADKERLVSALTSKLSHPRDEQPSRHSILELRGLGKEVWSGVDAEEYVQQERSSWNG
jgi:hypothetical protein